MAAEPVIGLRFSMTCIFFDYFLSSWLHLFDRFNETGMRDLPLYGITYVMCPQTGFYTSPGIVAFDSRLFLIALMRAIAYLYFDCVADFARF